MIPPEDRTWKPVAFVRAFSGTGPLPKITGLRPHEKEAFTMLFPQSDLDEEFGIEGFVSSYRLFPGSYDGPIDSLDVFFRYKINNGRRWIYALIMRDENREFFQSDLSWILTNVSLEICTNDWWERKHLRISYPSGTIETAYYDKDSRGYTIAG